MVRHLLFDYGVFAAPPVLLVVAWVRVLRAKSLDTSAQAPWMPLIIATSSDAYFWLSLTSPTMLMGEAFSSVRNYVIWANLFAALAVTVSLCFRKKVARWWLFAASLSLLLQWLWVGAVSSAV